MRTLGLERAKWRKLAYPHTPDHPDLFVTAADMIEDRIRENAVYRELKEREKGGMPARSVCANAEKGLFESPRPEEKPPVPIGAARDPDV